ncbi:hypothetical protein E1301_Tti021662 [Triplophysa tibetana]|uniref:HECT domain-containing protein n=1 Tax=Triplophysa tibetana TaxID=1572043 RepID=A0A5A9PI92_9TELE|nr:hypothetical protein E1301_Tti021662 [Triplophysa tibetana]
MEPSTSNVPSTSMDSIDLTASSVSMEGFTSIYGVSSASDDSFHPTDFPDYIDSPTSAFTSASTSTSMSDTRPDLKGLLLGLQSAVDLVEPGSIANCVNVVRSRVLQCALRTFNRRAFNPYNQLDVVFVDSFGTGLSRGTYKLLGMIISVCLVHGGVGPCVLSRRLFSQLSGVPDPPVNIAEVYDTEMQNQLDKIQRAETIAEAHTAMVEASDNLNMLDGDAAVEVDGGDRLSVTLQDVLVFASGASAIPVFGFKENPNITFLHENIDGNRRVFPEANTCSMTVKLPIGQEYDELCRFMTAALVQSPTFGVE